MARLSRATRPEIIPMKHTITVTSITERGGQSAVEIRCSCPTHPEGMDRAIALGRSTFPADKVHGWVLMANHPVALIRASAEHSGVYAVGPNSRF
jgi:hypothetical protein